MTATTAVAPVAACMSVRRPFAVISGEPIGASAMKSRRPSILSIAISAALALATSATLAQQGAGTAPETGALEEIVVTSRRVAEALQEPRISVSAFRAEDSEQRGSANSGDTAKFGPGFTTTAGP